MKNKITIGKAALAAGGSLLGTAGLGYGALVRLFCNLAFERKAILPMGRGENPDMKHPLVVAGREWLHANDREVVCMTAGDGARLYAHYFPAENAKATILEFHGWHGSWDFDFSASAPCWHERGYNLLIVEQRGQGQSDGKYMTFGIAEQADVSQWVSWYQEHYDAQIPILIAGISLGGATVLMASDRDYPPQVKGIVADCGFSSGYEIVRYVGASFFHMPEHPMCDGINAWCRRRLGLDLRDHSALEAVRRAKLPIFFVHGQEDTFVPWQMSVAMHLACTSRKELWLVEGAGHGQSFLVEPQEYLDRVEKFFA